MVDVNGEASEPALATVASVALILAFVVLATSSISACVPLSASDTCSRDEDCAADQQCTDISECATAEEAPSWKISWTINGQQPSPSAPEVCSNIDELELVVASTEESLRFSPLNCDSGQFNFRSIPLTFTNARLTAFDENGFMLGQARQFGARSAESPLNLELTTL